MDKNRVYEEASGGPFALRYKPLVAAPRQEDRLVHVIDLAATMYDLAGVQSPIPVDGQSLVPLMQGTDTWRDALFLEGWPGGVDNTEVQMPFEQAQTTISEHYQAIRLERWVD